MRQIAKTLKNLPLNTALFCFVLFLTVTVIDTALFLFTKTRFNWHKVQVATETDSGFLYYIEKEHTRFLKPTSKYYHITHVELAKIPDSIYVPMNTKIRRHGFFQNRGKTAAIVGDSFTIGEGVRDKETLGWMLGLEYHGYNFVNYGKQGIGAHSVCDRIKDKILPKKDSIKDIFYFYNLNDVFHTWPEEALTDFENISYEDMPLGGLLKHSTILSLLRRANIMRAETRRTIAIYKDIYFGQENKGNVNRMFNKITDTDKLLQQHGVKLHVVIYPLLHKDFQGNYPLAPIHDMLKKRLQKNDVSCIDATDAFKDIYFMSRMRVNPADYHPNGKANKLVARFVKEKIKLP